MHEKREWTIEEDRLLSKLVVETDENVGESINWHSIAKSLHDVSKAGTKRTDLECSKRWLYYIKPRRIEMEEAKKDCNYDDRFKYFPQWPFRYEKGPISILHGSWKRGSWTQLGGAIKENSYIRVEKANGFFLTGKVEAYSKDKNFLEWEHGSIGRNARFEIFEPNNDAETIEMIKKDHYWG